eukprot:scaffold287980_cov31-Tisochrysis_lutea.AAC.1
MAPSFDAAKTLRRPSQAHHRCAQTETSENSSSIGRLGKIGITHLLLGNGRWDVAWPQAIGTPECPSDH